MDEESKYNPLQNEDGNVEEVTDYVARMHSTILPHFPEEILKEWFYRHARHLDHYPSLGYESLRFEKQLWRLEDIPGREAFRDKKFCDNFSQTFDQRDDWLAKYMTTHGTWNTPIILFQNTHGGYVDFEGDKLNQPYHLLEGHRRLSFLVALRQQNRALPEHFVWLTTKDV